MAHTLRDVIRTGAHAVVHNGGDVVATSVKQLTAGDPATNFSQAVGISGVVIAGVGLLAFFFAAIWLAFLGRHKPRAWAGCAALFIMSIGPFIYYWLGLQNYAQFLSDPSNVVVEFWTWIALMGTIAASNGMMMFRSSLIAALASNNENRSMNVYTVPGITYVVILISGGWAAVTAFIMWNLSNTVIFFGVTSIAFAIAFAGCIGFEMYYSGASSRPELMAVYYMNIPYLFFWAFLIITAILGPGVSGFYTYAQISIGYDIIFWCYIAYGIICFWLIDYSKSDDDMGVTSFPLRETMSKLGSKHPRSHKTGEYVKREHDPFKRK